jgi:GNAT superfamily N-acetyltransferase
MAGYTIREAVTADKDILACMSGSIASEFRMPFSLSESVPDIQKLEEYYTAAGGKFWVLDVDGSICGCVAVLPVKGVGVEVKRFFLAPSWRKLGVGMMLLNTARNFAVEKGFGLLFTVIPEEMAAVCPRLENMGFEVDVPPEALDVPEGGVFMKDTNPSGEIRN